MRRQLNKRIKRGSRTRCLRQGLEQLEVRNLLAGDVLVADEVLPENEIEVEEGAVLLKPYFVDVEETAWTDEGGEPVESEPLLEKEPPADEQPDVEVLDFQPWMAYRTLTMADNPAAGEDVIELEAVEGDPILDEPLYFMAFASGIAEDGGEVVDGEVDGGEVDDGELVDDSEVIYTLSFGGDGEIAETVILEPAVGDEAAATGDEGDGGEIRYFGGVTSDNVEELAATSGIFMSDWYNRDNPLDANVDGAVTPLDALIVFNSLTHLGSVRLSHAPFALAAAEAAVDLDPGFLVDASNDGYLSPIDALMRINFLAEQSETDNSTAAPGLFASILPGEWDQNESSDRVMLDESSLLDDTGDDDSTVVFGARIRDPSIDWPDDELVDDPDNAGSADVFWSEFAGDGSDTILDDELLDAVAAT